MWPLQVVYRRRPRTAVYVRLAPVTIWLPTEGQRRARQLFAEAAGMARGMRGLAPDGLPWAAHFVREAMRGRRLGRKRREPRWAAVYRWWMLEAARLGYMAGFAKLYSLAEEKRWSEGTGYGTRQATVRPRLGPGEAAR